MKVIYFLRSLLCDFLMYLLMAIIGILGLPFALRSRENTYKVIRFYCQSIFVVLNYVAGLKVEFRGEIPTEPCIVCSKHQSFLDVLMLASVLPDFRFIMKNQVVHLPVIGFYARQIGCVAVNRNKKIGTVNKMLDGLSKEENRQTIVYPQGTRVLPNVKKPYKVGAALIYQHLQIKCHLVATNTGAFWARRSIYRYPGTAVIEFLGVLDTGMDIDHFMQVMEETVELASIKLLNEVEN
jgi:1-acyl-sn-glycerol-3-phosphate acyltransferase